ncbi:MAG: hypothetical protein KDC66_14350 [Phaeodactylibacter sp.]|nr:hypothetical protein [Phaeodactylibacter sp.]MCB9272928.1 hypothetical protein [Lewinellaceae bacterium]
MWDKSQEELDRLFQQGSEQYDFEYNAEAWAQMEALLDKSRRRRLFWWWLIGLACLLAIAVCFLSKEPPEMVDVKTGRPHAGQNILPNEKAEASAETPAATSGGVSQLPRLQVADESGPQPSGLPPSANTAKARAENKNLASELITPEGKLPKAATGHSATPAAQPQLSETDGTAGFPLPLPGLSFPSMPGDTLLATPLVAASREKMTAALLPVLPLVPVASGLSEVVTLEPYLPEPAAVGPSVKDDENINHALVLGLLAAGETASSGLDDFSRINLKFGGQVEYRYAGRYSTSLGLNYIRMWYEAGEGEYVPPKGFWTRQIAPQSTEGVCRILEIPVLVGYYPKGITASGFYARAGLTSYIMLREYYHYYYDLPDPDLIRHWGTKEDSRHWLGIGHFSAGFQQKIGGRFFLQAAPYLQVPLTGVGHGNVHLWSAGLNARFDFWLR